MLTVTSCQKCGMVGGRAHMDLSEPFDEDNCGVFVPDMMRHVLRYPHPTGVGDCGAAWQPAAVYKKFSSFVVYLVIEGGEESPLFCLDMLTVFLKAFTIVAQSRAVVSSGLFTPFEALAAGIGGSEKLSSSSPLEAGEPIRSPTPGVLDLVENLPTLQHVCDYMFTGGCIAASNLEEITNDVKSVLIRNVQRNSANALLQALF